MIFCAKKICNQTNSKLDICFRLNSFKNANFAIRVNKIKYINSGVLGVCLRGVNLKRAKKESKPFQFQFKGGGGVCLVPLVQTHDAYPAHGVN